MIFRYIKALLQALIEENNQKGWKETLSKEKYDMKWVSSGIEDDELIKILNNQDKKVLINRYPGIQGLVHKDTFIRVMSIGLTEIPTQLGAEMVVQRYIHNPLLVEGLKFDLRIYVVITQVNPIQAFICDEGLARFCTEPYETPTKENFKKFFMHLTNYSINKHHEDYKESENILEPNNDTKRTLESLYKTLDNLNINTAQIKENIKQTCMRTLSVYGPIIEHGVAVASNMKPINGKYFQILGFDLLIDENLDAHLLEINDHPSLNIFLEKDYMGGGMGKSLSQIDLYVKKRVVGDSIKLSKKSSQQLRDLQEFRSLTKIYPDEQDESSEVARLMNKLRQIYYEIAPCGIIKASQEYQASQYYSSTNIANSTHKVESIEKLFQNKNGIPTTDVQQFKGLNEQEQLEQPNSFVLNKEYVLSDTNEFSQNIFYPSYFEGPEQDKTLNLTQQRFMEYKTRNALNSDLQELLIEDFQDQRLLGESSIIKLKDKDPFKDCEDSYFKNTDKKCQSCPTGCKKCSSLDMADQCESGFTLIYGKNFGYCFPTCPVGYYIQTKFTNKNSYLEKNRNANTNQKNQNPTLMVSQCQKCNFGCGDCFFDEYYLKPFCYTCMKGFKYNETSGGCDVVPCKSGEYRPKPLNSSVNIDVDSKYDDYLCQPCSNGCVNCTNTTTCMTCDSGFAIFKKQAQINSSCVGCTSYCKNCAIINSTTSNKTNCTACIPKFILKNDNTCELNRTCAVGYWFNDTKVECQTCPDNCPTCKQGAKNGTVICTTCTQQSVLNSQTQLCDDRCNSTEAFYNTKISQCTTCFNTSFPDQSTQACLSCPNYCNNCYYNKTTKRPECNNCTQEGYMDQTQKQCRVNCNDSAVFNFDKGICVNCLAGQFLNISTNSCQSCPTNCSSCSFSKQNSRVECSTCNNSMIVDYSTKKCRKSCNTSQQYDWTKNTCVNCSSNTIYNSTTQQCQACPNGCKSCAFNQTSQRVECSVCDTFKVLDADKKLCKDSCYFGKTYFWEAQECRYCPLYQYKGSDGQCKKCPFGCPDCYSQGSNTYCNRCNETTVFDIWSWKCKLECTNQTVFNWDTNTCENCPSGQYFDTASNNCKTCNTNCAKCEKKFWYSATTDCKACKDGYVLDVKNNVCRKPCPSTQIYNDTTQKCQNCSSNMFVNITSQQCQTCPSDCQDCIMDNNTLKVNCTSCKSGIYDSQQYKCRPNCDSEKYFNWTQSTCQDCPTSTYFEQKTQQCESCPVNCTKCIKNNQGKFECQSCASNTQLDAEMLLCKPDCPSKQIYDFDLFKCRSCGNGQYQNSTSKCADCPGYCTSCEYFTANKSTSCYTCKDGSYLDNTKKDCRPYCSDSQYYDWSKKTCVNCASTTFLNKTTDQCQNCPNQCQSCKYNPNTNSAECSTCKSGYVFDSQYNDCKLSCNSTAYFDWNSRTCINCASNQFLNQDIGQCQNCPSGCQNCVYNQNTQNLQCGSCSSGYTYDQTMRLCYPNCGANQFYNWDTNMCQKCQSTQYLNSTTLQCNDCPSNCATCSLNSDNNVKCDSCSSGFQLDSTTFTCRQSCNSTSVYNSNTKQCTQCQVGTWLNSTAQNCQSCPQGCYQCSANSLGQPECSSCLSGLVLDSSTKKCKKSCTTGQYFDYDTFECKSCSSNCDVCSSSSTCTTCNEQYTLQSGSCTNKCTSTQTWNTSTKKCDDPVSSVAKITLSASSASMIRCREYTVSIAIVSGMTTGNVNSVVWSYTNDLKRTGDYVIRLDAIIKQANVDNALSIKLDSLFTESVTAQFSITILATVSSTNTSTATNSTKFVIYPQRYTTISNYNTSYTIDGTVGLTIKPQFNYPECTLEKGPIDLPTGTDIGCQLYDSRSNYIKDLTNCKIAANDATNGLAYFVKYYYLPHAYQTALRDTITISTIIIQSSCQIASSNLITVSQSESLMLNVSVQNQKSSFVYKWACYSLVSGAQCGVIAATQNQPNLNLPASGFTGNAKYAFVLSILDNSVNQTACTAYVQINSAFSANFALLLATSSQSATYMDSSVSNNVLCSQTKTNSSDVQYKISIIKVNNSQSSSGSSSSSSSLNSKTIVSQSAVIVQQSNAVVIPKDTLQKDTTYQIICNAANDNANESVSTTINTNIQLNQDLDFQITPKSGIEKSTVFNFKVVKPKDQDLWCRFGYNLTKGTTYLNDLVLTVYNDKEQKLQSTLVMQNNKASSQHVMVARCFNKAGQYSEAFQTVTLSKSTNTLVKMGTKLTDVSLSLAANSGKLIFEQIENQYEAYQQLEENQLSNQEREQFLAQTLQQIEEIANQLTTQQLRQTCNMLTEIWNEIKKSPKIQTIKLINQMANTCIALLFESLQDNVVRILDQDQFLTFIGIYDEMLSNFISALQKEDNLIKRLIESIKIGAARLASNIQADKTIFSASGQNFAVQIDKKSKSELIKLQQKNSQNQFPTAFESKNLTLASSTKQVVVSIPYYLMMSQYDYVIMSYILISKDLNYKEYSDRHMSDIIEVNAYFSSSPIAITGVYDIGEITISNMNQMMHISLPYNIGSNENRNHALCGYLEDDDTTWQKIECKADDDFVINSQLKDTKICCTNHLTLFGLVYDKYFDELQEIAFRQIIYSMIPVSMIYIALLVAIANTVCKYRRRLRQNPYQNSKQNMVDQESMRNNNGMVPSTSRSETQDERNIQIQQIDKSPNDKTDFSMINITQVEMMANDVEEPRAKKSDNINKIPKNKKKFPVMKSIFEVVKLSKLYKFFFELNKEGDIFTIIFQKVILCNLFLLSFTITMIICYYAKELSIIIVASYIILLLFIVLFKQFQGVINNGTAIKHIWFASHLILLFVQPAVIAQLADNVSVQNFDYYLIGSCIILCISCTFEDMILIPAYNKITKFLDKKLKYNNNQVKK
eukprot:403355394